MSWYFDEVDDYVTLADHAALTLPNGDWTIAGWIKPTDNVGALFQYLLSWGTLFTANNVQLYLGEASHATTALRNKLLCTGQTTGGGDFVNGGDQPSTSDVGAATTWQHIVFRFTQSTKTFQYFINGAADRSWVMSAAAGEVNSSGALYFGGRSSSPTDRYFGGRMAEWAKWNSGLDSTQITALAAGNAPSIVGSPAWYCPMINSFTESVNGIAVTASGSVIDADHPTITYSTAAALAGNAAATASASGTLAGGDAAALAGNAAAQATASATLNAVTIFNTADRGTVDLANSSVTPNGTTPTIFIRNRWFADNSSGARASFFHVTGVNGMTPVFEVDRSNMELSNATNKFLWSYTGALGSWQEFTTTTRETTPNVYRSSNASAFTQDTVYVSMQYPWRIGYTLPWIQSLESSGFISYAPSGAASYQFETRSATTNGSAAGVGDVIPAQPLYSFKISSGAGSAPDGNPKRKMVLGAGMHAAEDVGNYALKGAVEFLVSADAQAASVRSWFDIFVYPCYASAGRAGGATRNDFENNYKSEDVNRAWDDLPILETVAKHKAAILADAGSTIDVLFDFHGDYTSAMYDYFSSSVGKRSVWQNAIQQYIPGHTVTQFDTVGTIGVWAYGSKGAAFAVTPEHAYGVTLNLANVAAYGANHIKAVAYLIAQGEWGQVAISGAALGVASASGALTTDIPLSGAAVATSSASGSMEAQVSLSGAALAQAVSSALLSTGIVMTAAAVAQAAGQGTLATAIQMLGTAQAQAGGSGSLTTSTGGLEGNAQASASAAASLTTEIRLAGAAVAQASASGALAGASVDLAGAAVATAYAGADLTVTIALTAQALASAIASGGLTTQIVLQADATARAAAGASLFGVGAMPVRPTVTANRFAGTITARLQ